MGRFAHDILSRNSVIIASVNLIPVTNLRQPAIASVEHALIFIAAYHAAAFVLQENVSPCEQA